MNTLVLTVLLLGQCSNGRCGVGPQIQPWWDTIEGKQIVSQLKERQVVEVVKKNKVVKQAKKDDIRIINGKIIFPKDIREQIVQINKQQKALARKKTYYPSYTGVEAAQAYAIQQSFNMRYNSVLGSYYTIPTHVHGW
jgi:hypothetical protein